MPLVEELLDHYRPDMVERLTFYERMYLVDIGLGRDLARTRRRHPKLSALSRAALIYLEWYCHDRSGKELGYADVDTAHVRNWVLEVALASEPDEAREEIATFFKLRGVVSQPELVERQAPMVHKAIMASRRQLDDERDDARWTSQQLGRELGASFLACAELVFARQVPDLNARRQLQNRIAQWDHRRKSDTDTAEV